MSSLAMTLLLGTALASPQQSYDQGLTALREGRHDVARDHLLDAVEQGGADPHVYHALGNALYRTGDKGGATAAWRRGQRLAPRNGDIAANLDRVRKQREDRLPAPSLAPWAFFWMAFLSPRDGAILASAFSVLALGGAFVRTSLRRRGRPGPAVGIETWLGVVLALLMALSTQAAVQADRGVVIRADEVRARSALGPEGVELFALHAAAEASLLEQAGDHVLIGLDDERKGWVSADAVVLTDPSAPFPR